MRPLLQPDQVAHLLTRIGARRQRSRRDVGSAPGSDHSHSGWGRLDVARRSPALAGPIPTADRFESNDDAGRARTPLGSDAADFAATIDFWDDQNDVYKLFLRKRQRVTITLDTLRRADTDLVLWKPGTQRIGGLSLDLLRQRAATSATRRARERIVYRARSAGWYFVRRRSCSPATARTASRS